MTQITKDQHYVPKFYLKLFADNEQIQVLDVRARRIGRQRHYSGVCYDKFFYGERTGVEDDVSQVFEEFFGLLETQIATDLPTAIAHAHSGSLDSRDLNTLAYMMSVQWLRTDFFRQRMMTMESDMRKKMAQMEAHFPGFIERTQQTAKEHGKETTREQARELREYLLKGEYTITTGNRTHLQFLTPDRVEGFHNLFYRKQWNVFKASGNYRFITSDNPVSEWIPNTGAYGASFFERQHYFSLTPELFIESLPPNMDALDVPPADTVRYATCSNDDVLMYSMVVAQHCGRFAYARGTAEFTEMLRQLEQPDTALIQFLERFVKPVRDRFEGDDDARR